ncbi:helix-turn-helix domain-containing protein [Acetivibrio cellulolyticus]|uniref:helix-turn-helix domain-containing protein n=1 Tax=Acetivibrio cellulolyticus TaxID=35830 RepID=UPI0001E2F0BC|nr:helix-turn-helix transcriptional regulator [Acetivibrio cellulolyticus]
MSILGELFREIRLSKNWSIRQAAKNMGISYSYLSILEKGIDPRTGKDSNPKPEMLKIISKAYNYPYEELMKAAGYLNDDNNYSKKFDPIAFLNNLRLIMGKMSIEEFSSDIHDKTGYQIKSEQIRSYLSGDIQPFPGTLNILSKYAQVSKDFWVNKNTDETFLYEKKNYNETVSKLSQESLSKDYLSFSSLSEELKEFILNKDNNLYLKYAMEAKKKGINPNTLNLLDYFCA